MKRSGDDRFANDKSDMNKIFFTADLHFGLRNILRDQTDRPFADRDDTEAHDAWLLDLWRSTVDKKDMVYILGDLTFFKSEDARHLLEKLPGRKYLITGNHDGSIKAYSNYFQTTAQILDLRGPSEHVLPADGEHGAEPVPLSIADLEPQASRLGHAARALPWQVR